MAVEVPALAEFSDRLGTASWFSMIGEPLTPAEQTDAARYMSCLGLDEVETQGIGSWESAEACIKSTDWNSDWWDAEDRLLVDLNPWVADRTLSRPVRGETVRPDGFTVEYWVMPPTTFERDANGDPLPHPTVLEIHGGPSAMWGPGESSMWHEFQVLCGRGYGVVYANPRGSGGYGEAFERGNHQDWGAGPAGDVLAALDDAALAPWVDKDRLFVTGGSYGGYLTAWIIANDQRFKAAVAQRGVYDLNTFFGEGNAWRLFEWAMGGPPWDARLQSVIRRNNPFSYVNRIRTPLLILHASQDLRTGVSQSEMMYRALKELDKPVEYVRYPNAGHDLSRTGDPHQRMDRLNRIVEFFERFVANPRPAPRLGDEARGEDGGTSDQG